MDIITFPWLNLNGLTLFAIEHIAWMNNNMTKLTVNVIIFSGFKENAGFANVC